MVGAEREREKVEESLQQEPPDFEFAVCLAKLLGECRMNLQLLSSGVSEFKLQKRHEQTVMKSGEFSVINEDKIRQTGLAQIEKFSLKSRPTFIDHLRSDCKIKTLFAVDFSCLNGQKGKPN